MSEEEKTVKLKVMEALQEEAYKGIVRIDSQTMQDIGVRRGDIVEINGARLTVGIVDRAYPTDVGQAVIRMDGILRRNAKTGLGEYVTVKKAKIKEAKEVTIAPAQQGVTIQADPIFFKRGLLGRAVVKGDQVALGGARRRRRTMTGSPFEEIFDIFESELSGFGGFGSSLRFIVVQIDPKEAVIITENTKVKVNPKSVDVVDEKLVEVTYEDIGGLREEVKKIREMVELPLRHPEIFERLGVQPPKGVLLHGPPGTGKTLLAKAVANETNAHFIHLDAPAVMCVEGKTEILTNQSFIRAEQLFEEAKNKGKIEYSNKLEIIKLNTPIKVNSIDENLKIKEGNITHITKLNAEGYKIKTSTGEELIVSHNQPFATLNNNKIKWKILENLKIGEEILKINTENIIQNNSRTQQLGLTNIGEATITTCKIKEIEKIGKQTLYDFTINPYENFIATEGMLILHNSKYVGEAERKIREIFEEAEKNAPSIIFLDEIDAIASKREESYGEVERRVVAQLLATMDGLKSRGKVIVIAATNRPNSIDPALRRPGRFDREVEIGVPKYEGRLQILKIHTRNMPLAEDVILEELARVTHGFVGADLEAICKEAAMVVLRRILPDLKFQKDEPLPTELLENLEIKFNDFKEALKIVRPSALREVLIEAPNVRWNDIGGLEQIKQQLKEAVEWPLKNPEVFKRLGVRPPRGILLYGPPGTGKTMLAKSVATESEANFILVKGAELLCLDENTNVFTDFCGVRKIKEAYENMKKISKIIKKNKKIEVRKILQPANTYAINKKGKITKTKIEKMYKLWVNDAYKVKTTDNNEIIVSKNQPFYTFKEGGIKWIKAEDIKEGDFIAKPAKIYTFDKKIVIPLPNYKHLRLIKEDRNNYYVKIFSSKKITKLPKQLDTKLASFLGWFISEGNISGHDVLICNENKKNRKEIKKLFEMFVENERIQEPDKGIGVSSTPLIKYMEGIFETKLGTKKSYTITIPPIITKSNKKIISAFIRTLYKGDGHIGETKIEYGSMSKSVTETLNYLLLNFGIKSKFWQRSDGMNMNTISGIREIKKFKNAILNENHSLDVRKEYNAQYIIPKLNKYLKYCKEKLKLHYDKEIKDGSFEHIISGRRKCGLIRLQKLMKIFEKYATREFKKDLIFNTLKQISEGDLTWTQVRGKMKVEPRIMYDFETQHGSFIGGNIPLVLHNSKWVGDSEKGVKKVFEKARQASPTVIFFDEIDALAPRRGRNSDTNVTERVVNQLLTEIDGLEELNDVVVIGATNRPDIMDPALLRPGRFDRLILTPVPDKDSRVMILEIHTKKMPLAQDVDLHALAEKTVNYVGADIESLCRESAMLALRENMEAYEVKMLHFEKALEKVKPSIREEEIKRYEEIEEDYLQTARSAEINKKDMNYFG